MNAALVQPASTGPATRVAAARGNVFSRWMTERPVAVTLWAALIGALMLQLWRPFFFLTCDTLSATLPVAVEAYRRLWEGRSPFYNPYLFGGFNLLGDLGHFTLWSPLALPFSFLARTRYYYLLPDIVGTLSFPVIAGAFCWSAMRLRRSLDLPVQPPMIVALSLSYAFTPYNFIVGASWIGFLNAQAAYPLILAGAFERNWRHALAIQAAALLYAIFGGHMHLFTVMLVFGGLTILLAARVRRSAQPIFVWVAAGLLTAILILPLLWPALVGFSQTSRSAGVSLGGASRNDVPLTSLAASMLLGPMAQGLVGGIRIDFSDRLYNLAIAFTLANLPLAGFLVWKRRWNTLEIGLLVLALVTAVCIDRPDGLARIIAVLPLLKSLRWPFREIAVLQFLLHALFLVSFRPLTAPFARMTVLGCGLAGSLLFALVFLSPAPTFFLFQADRELIISGEADRYWDNLRTSQAANGRFPRFAVQAEPRLLMPTRSEVPFALLGAFNYASLFRVPSVTGFSVTPPPNALWIETELGVKAWFWGGIYSDWQIARIVAAHPDIRTIVLTGMKPATWKVFNGPAAESFRLDTDTPSGRPAVTRIDPPGTP